MNYKKECYTITTVTVNTELTDSQTLALAQFIKRLIWSEMRVCAIDDDETLVMKDTIRALQESHAYAGFSPR